MFNDGVINVDRVLVLFTFTSQMGQQYQEQQQQQQPYQLTPEQQQQPYTLIPEQQQPYTFTPEQQPYSQSNEEEPHYILKTYNPYTFYVPDKYDPDHFMRGSIHLPV